MLGNASNYLLTADPVVCTLASSRYRFQRPGLYKVRLVTKLFLNDDTARSTDRQGKQHYANIVRDIALEIVPSSPEWEKEVIRKGVEAASKPQPAQNRPEDPEEVRYWQDIDTFCALDSVDGVHAMVGLLAEGRRIDCIRDTLHRSEAIAELRSVMIQPDVRVSSTFFFVLTDMMSRREQDTHSRYDQIENVRHEVREALLAALPEKTDEARAETLATILSYPPQQSEQTDDFPDKPRFRDAVIRLAAGNFESLPEETRNRLLGNYWEALRSPLMLDAVRRQAQAGNGQALLRWVELEPAAAIAFEREEVVRTVPRFSSYYLRLPDVSLPRQEAVMARNFVALRDPNDLMRGASLLHRYATRAVLPVVLPFVDENLDHWPNEVRFPALAYLLKVAPEEAEPRIRRVLRGNKDPREGPCCHFFLSSLGILEPSPVLERIALDQIKTRPHWVRDLSLDMRRGAFEYLEEWGSPRVKPVLWNWLLRWRKDFANVPAPESGVAPSEQQHERSLQLEYLLHGYAYAHAWVQTPEDVEKLRTVTGDATLFQRDCYKPSPAGHRPAHAVPHIAVQRDSGEPDFQGISGCEGAIGPEPDTFEIRYEYTRGPFSEVRETTSSQERLSYSIRQYQCRNLQSLKEKILQLPKGSTFEFTPIFNNFDEVERKEVIEIVDFLEANGYKVHVPKIWNFVQGSVAM
ncbi:MAG TPA: hypothetical protein VGN16_07525 [Acidobacteriaceae bacterium]